MHWLRPMVGWGAFLLIHAVTVPLVYGIGKAHGLKEAQEAGSASPKPLVNPNLSEQEFPDKHKQFDPGI